MTKKNSGIRIAFISHGLTNELQTKSSTRAQDYFEIPVICSEGEKVGFRPIEPELF
jgi:hypothetical protein